MTVSLPNAVVPAALSDSACASAERLVTTRKTMPTLLVVEDEPVLARNLVAAFSRPGLFDVVHAPRLAAARELVADKLPDVALLDLRLPDGSGLDLLEWLRARDLDLPVIMMTAYSSVPEAVRALQLGACDYVAKPLDLDEIQRKVEQAIRNTRRGREVSYYRQREIASHGILGESAAMVRMRGLVERLARMTGAAGGAAPTVLLMGETGTGKGHVARALHAGSGRSDGPFVEINCAALPEQLVEAELFGHERGAFTDAKVARAGLFETADGGTLFLDEIGHMPVAVQAKLLKVIEEKTVRRLGGTVARRVDVQIVAATSRDLAAAVARGEFPEDLYQRLSVAVLQIPPLRDRDADVLLLARAFLHDACRRYGVPMRPIGPAAEAALLHHRWPGNVREVANVMERVVLFSDANPVEVDDLGLPLAASTPGAVAVAPSGEVQVTFPDAGLSLEAVERAVVGSAMSKAGGNQSAAARLLGVTRDVLRSRLQKYGLDT